MGILVFLLIVICVGFIIVWIISAVVGAVAINQAQEQLNELSICRLGDDNHTPIINFQTMMAWHANYESKGSWMYVRRKDDGTWQSKLTQETKEQDLKDLYELKNGKFGHLPIVSDADERIEKVSSNKWAAFHDDYNAQVEHQYQQYQTLVKSLTKS